MTATLDPFELRHAVADAAMLRHARLLTPNAAPFPRREGMLNDDEGTETKHVGFRAPADLLDRVDAYALEVRRRTGVRASRTDALVALLSMSLDVLDAVKRDPHLTPEPATVRDLVDLALDGLSEARRKLDES